VVNQVPRTVVPVVTVVVPRTVLLDVVTVTPAAAPAVTPVSPRAPVTGQLATGVGAADGSPAVVAAAVPSAVPTTAVLTAPAMPPVAPAQVSLPARTAVAAPPASGPQFPRVSSGGDPTPAGNGAAPISGPAPAAAPTTAPAAAPVAPADPPPAAPGPVAPTAGPNTPAGPLAVVPRQPDLPTLVGVVSPSRVETLLDGSVVEPPVPPA
jgi:hypothetical protein